MVNLLKILITHFSFLKKKNNDASEKIANYQVEQAMLDARQDFSKKSSFMGALNFLNSQATISLISKRAKSFEALA